MFRDIDFRTSEALVAENEKIVNIEQRFGEATLQQDLQAMSLTTRQKSIKKEEIREKCWL